ncbi:hypothetical protein HIM_09663 [Hirsutella minnesotensis 3608]|uniref:MULE transposase domain-containing protein n=1 Tax=Hirsutella minnesotensis 3608 TaxID=1043627 RepID=A0A0F8A2Z9_9HYPO|nr:hypothetical protein HIM_09663 [Hirsutella minnesotensis 3608]
MSFDNTYNTNRFKLPLFQVTGQTCLKSVYNALFGLIDNEKREGLQFLAEGIRQLNDKHDIPLPEVVITDYDQQMKASLDSQPIKPSSKSERPLSSLVHCIAIFAAGYLTKRYGKPRGSGNVSRKMNFQLVQEFLQRPLVFPALMCSSLYYVRISHFSYSTSTPIGTFNEEVLPN